MLRFARRVTGQTTTRGAIVRPNKIKQMWRDGKFVTLGWLSVSHGFTAEVMARQGFDALVVDMQHGLTDMNDVWPMLQAISQTDTVPVVMGMIETKEGLANLDAICATPGLDAVYIGPSDLAFALGMNPRPDNPDPVHMATCDKIRDAAHKHGIKACMHCASAAFAAGAVKRGFDLFMLTSDLASMVAGVRRQLDELKAATSA